MTADTPNGNPRNEQELSGRPRTGGRRGGARTGGAKGSSLSSSGTGWMPPRSNARSASRASSTCSYSPSSRFRAARATIRRARDKHPSARLVLVVSQATPAEARQLLVDDVPGLVLEQHAEIALALAVRAAFAGQISYPAELMPTQLRAALSNREKQILGMVVMGFSNAEIAAKLHVSESTVKSHLYSAFATIGVRIAQGGSRADPRSERRLRDGHPRDHRLRPER